MSGAHQYEQSSNDLLTQAVQLERHTSSAEYIQYVSTLADFVMESELLTPVIEPCSTNYGQGYRQTVNLPGHLILEQVHMPDHEPYTRVSIPMSADREAYIDVQYGGPSNPETISAEVQGWHRGSVTHFRLDERKLEQAASRAAHELGGAVDELIQASPANKREAALGTAALTGVEQPAHTYMRVA